jgi:hypothetical protein
MMLEATVPHPFLLYYFVLLSSTFLPTTNFVFPASSETTSDEMHLIICRVFADLVPTYVTSHRLVLRRRVVFGNIFQGKNATHVVGNVVICPKF